MVRPNGKRAQAKELSSIQLHAEGLRGWDNSRHIDPSPFYSH